MHCAPPITRRAAGVAANLSILAFLNQKRHFPTLELEHLGLALSKTRFPINRPSPRRAARLQQVINIRPNLGGIPIPLLHPIPIKLPARPHRLPLLRLAPLVDGFVRLPEPLIRPQMRRRGDFTSRKRRRNHLAKCRDGGIKFNANLEVHDVVEVDGNVPAGAFHLLGAECVPDSAAGLGNDGGELLHGRLPAHDGKRSAGKLLDANVVIHDLPPLNMRYALGRRIIRWGRKVGVFVGSGGAAMFAQRIPLTGFANDL